VRAVLPDADARKAFAVEFEGESGFVHEAILARRRPIFHAPTVQDTQMKRNPSGQKWVSSSASRHSNNLLAQTRQNRA
jgi:hypothetical protein